MKDRSAAEAPIVGILGGMGPAATADFYTKLIEATPAATDQEHLRVVIWADPTVPDRSQAITGGGEDPTPKLAEGARRLKEAGAGFYVVACNSAHAFLAAVREQVDLEYLSLIDVTADHIASLPHTAQAGLLATDATVGSQLYQQALETRGVAPVIPTPEDQQVVMEAIYAVKASRMSDEQRAALAGVAERLADRGADVIIAGCTEIPLALSDEQSPRPLIDPAGLLVRRVLEEVAARQEDAASNDENPAVRPS